MKNTKHFRRKNIFLTFPFEVMLPYWASRHFDAIAHLFRVHPSSADGNCFFDSIRCILESMRIRQSIEELRDIVAKPVLDDNNSTVTNTVASWLELYEGAAREADRNLLQEYGHVEGVTLPLNADTRQHLYSVMKTPRYWGEQHACRMIEERFQIRFLIFNCDILAPQINQYYTSSYKPTHFCFLYLNRQHYEPVSFRGVFLFEWKDIPHAIQLFFSRAYSSTK